MDKEYVQGESLVLTGALDCLRRKEIICVSLSSWRLSTCFMVDLTLHHD